MYGSSSNSAVPCNPENSSHLVSLSSSPQAPLVFAEDQRWSMQEQRSKPETAGWSVQEHFRSTDHPVRSEKATNLNFKDTNSPESHMTCLSDSKVVVVFSF